MITAVKNFVHNNVSYAVGDIVPDDVARVVRDDLTSSEPAPLPYLQGNKALDATVKAMKAFYHYGDTPPAQSTYRAADGTSWPVVTVEPASMAAFEHDVRVSELRRHVGTVTVTAKAAVAIVMDHGLNKFDATVRGLLEARGIPVTLALNSNWEDPNDARYGTNNAVTPAMVKTWVDAGWLEPANHGRTHAGYTTDREMTSEIVTGREELEAMLGHRVDSWIQPAMTTGDGFDSGGIQSEYWSTHTGRSILRSHAVISGLAPGSSLYPLDGEPVTGMKGGWIDGGTADAETAISSAITAGRGYIVRFHPQFLDDTGKISTAGLTAFLDKLVAWRDAGDIDILPLRKFAIAEKALPAPVDTGVVNLSLPADTLWTSVASMTVQRYGKTVTLAVRDAKQSNLTGNQTLVTLPLGYRPAVNLYQDSYQGTRTWIDTAGNLTFVGPLAQEFIAVTFITEDAPPA